MRILSEEAVDGVRMKCIRIFCFLLLWFDSGLIFTFLVWREANFNKPQDKPSRLHKSKFLEPSLD